MEHPVVIGVMQKPDLDFMARDRSLKRYKNVHVTCYRDL